MIIAEMIIFMVVIFCNPPFEGTTSTIQNCPYQYSNVSCSLESLFFGGGNEANMLNYFAEEIATATSVTGLHPFCALLSKWLSLLKFRHIRNEKCNHLKQDTKTVSPKNKHTVGYTIGYQIVLMI